MRRNKVKAALIFSLFIILVFCGGCGKKEVEKEEKKASVNEELSANEKTRSNENEEIGGHSEKKEPAASLEIQGMDAQIESIVTPVTDMGGKVAVYVQNLQTGEWSSYGNECMQAASLIKLFVASAVEEQWELVQQQEAYAGETDDLLRNMITISDNEATNELVIKLGEGDPTAGMSVVNQFCQTRGFLDTHMGRLLLQQNPTGDNLTSVEDCGKFLLELYKGTLPGSEKILELMKQQERTGKIPSGVPDGVVTANKTGELTDVENDVAIVYGENGPYSISVMMSELTDPYSARLTIVQLSSEIYETMGRMK